MFTFKHLIMLGLVAVAAVTVFLQPPIPQDLSYHGFADRRGLLGIPNFLNIITNLPFLAVGVTGILWCLSPRHGLGARWAWLTCFIGVALVGFGSSYYHLEPDNATLVWDRLPMSIGFMGLFVGVLSDHINPRLEKWLLIPAIAVGIFSVVYWRVTDDLRIYVLVQFLPLVMIPTVMALFRTRPSDRSFLVAALVIYLAAKIAEHFDHAIYRLTDQIISGHSVKHLLAATALFVIYRMLRTRAIK